MVLCETIKLAMGSSASKKSSTAVPQKFVAGMSVSKNKSSKRTEGLDSDGFPMDDSIKSVSEGSCEYIK